jgi:phenylalanine-4-hydroxylase
MPGLSPLESQHIVTDPIPEHLLPYVVAQEPERYTPMDHAVWRFILKIGSVTLKDAAHPHYLCGLAATGISVERIPLISEMDACLRRFGWRAVGVSGFIPPAIFMEFQALGILPIACDMRKLENIAYTPAPDIVHEAAGHAPMIANADYAHYLRQYGDIARKAIYSKNDMAIYMAIRTLSETKEDPNASDEAVLKADEDLMMTEAHAEYLSEGAQLSRFYWWTVEYGLIGSLQNPKIYGAGILSSVGETETCLKKDVTRIPFSLDAVHTAYDITRPQPQLFVTGDFKALTQALLDFSQIMAFRQGGLLGLGKARQAGTVTTAELDSGIQVSGVLSRLYTTPEGDPAYLQYQGPCQLGVRDVELPGHGPQYHAEGYGTAIGRVTPQNKPLSRFNDADWSACGFDPLLQATDPGTLTFQSGLTVTGRLTGLIREKGLTGLTWIASFEDATVSYEGRTLFQPEWGTYDLACGEHVASVFGGAADRVSYLSQTDSLHPPKRPQKSNHCAEHEGLYPLYQQVRELRNAPPGATALTAALNAIVAELPDQLEDDWLLRWELLELNHTQALNAPWAESLVADLKRFATDNPDKAFLIDKGLALLT